MKLFLQANDYEFWRIVTNGSSIPRKRVECVVVPKEEDEWDENDIKKVQLNAKAMNTLFCALGPNQYNRVSLCDNAKEIWDKLEVTHEGTSRVNESMIHLLAFDYELFEAKPEEGIKEMLDRFTHIINGLKAFGKTYPNKEMVKKMMNSLPTSWKPKVTAIEESKDINPLSLDELIINYNAKEVKEVPKKVGVAWKSTTCEKNEYSSNDDDEEMTMFAKIFKRFMKSNKGRQFQKNEGLKNESTKEKDPIVCYKCKKPGHKKRGSRKQKLKVHIATWSDDDSSDNEDQEVAKIFLMVIDNVKSCKMPMMN
ncbi:zf-CCHC domain-containing protein/UBN2 domain-containing protein [Gossypium australe]|uniref:Zf-CCHC domain-containing protein/UBN2 domain-containing protein n=1 Tax=Gossypium australe TaxID=47621 RepID=A0A5B6VX35_9ROSI|nr:zf-CCHC domain-containing protein/UBN2 domain-containing protein [Gossypium australe]